MVRAAALTLAFFVAGGASAQVTDCQTHGNQTRCETRSDTVAPIQYPQPGLDLSSFKRGLEIRAAKRERKASERTAKFTPPSIEFNSLTTGNDLTRGCAIGSPSETSCLAMLTGFHSAVLFMEARKQPLPYCLRSGVELGQVRDQLLIWLNANPGKRDLPTWAILPSALREAWPCA